MGHKKKKATATPTLIEPMFEPTFPRPTKLSDALAELYQRREHLDAIVEKAPGELNWNDFREIFQSGMSAEDIPNSGFYLPWSFGYLRNQPEDAFEILSNLIAWISENAKDLNDSNGTLEQVRNALRDCLGTWTSKFEVIHRDVEICGAEGCYKVAYDDSVVNSWIVCELLDELCHQKAHADLAIRFISSLASTSATPTQSAWFLELVNQFNCGHFRDWKRPRHRKQLHVLKDESLWNHHAAVVLEKVAPITKSPTYWNETLFFL